MQNVHPSGASGALWNTSPAVVFDSTLLLPFNIVKQHWVALKIVLETKVISVYDSIPGCIRKALETHIAVSMSFVW